VVSLAVKRSVECLIVDFTGNLSGQGLNFPWKTLPTFLGKNGLVLYNYPEDALMPGELRDMNQKSKGINDLTLRERGVLSDALKDGSLTLKHFHAKDYPHRLLASCNPVIYGKAPGPHSPHEFGCRLFVNGRIDRKGPSRLSPDESSPAPIVRGVDARELILGIACLTQNSTATEATGDAVDELEMAGQSPEY
jgi:hypothetical protein